MKILLVAATKAEIAPLLKNLKAKKKDKNLFSFSSGRNRMDVLITGVGIANTAFRLGKIFASNRYDLAINAGIAGSFRKDLPLGIVVNVTSDCFADFGAEDGERMLTAKEIGLVKAFCFKSTGLSNKIIKALPEVKGITVNTVHGNNASITRVRREFDPDVESMEGAAFLLACDEENIRCIQVRTISNYVERRNRKSWKIEKAIKNLNEALSHIVNSMS